MCSSDLRVVTAPPPFSAVLADCESIIATVGVAFRPCAFRTCSRSALPARSHTPLARQARNCSWTDFQSGNPWATAATGNRSSPHTASRPPPGGVDTCEDGLQHAAGLEQAATTAPASTTEHPSNHSDTCPQTTHQNTRCIFLSGFLA